VVNGQASLEGDWPHLKLGGNLLVNNAQFHTGFFRSEQHKEITILPRNCSPPSTENSTARALETTFWKNLAINAGMDVPGGVWVRDKAMKVEVRGRITAHKSPSQPVFLGGKLQAVEGTYTIRDKAFKLDKASLTFPGVPGGKMHLEARAFHEMDDITLFVVVAGNLDNLRTHLESQPPLPQRDLLSYLLFDRPASSLTRDEYLSASQKAVGILGGLTAQKLKDILGGKLPLIGDIATTGSKDSVGVGKKLTKDITVSYERKLNPLRTEDLNQVRIDYKINKYLSVESQVGRRNSGGDVFLNLDF
jgi:translocation and assembly module TamB